MLFPDAMNAFGGDPACTPTSRDLFGLGPFHEDNAPFRLALASSAEPGRRLTIGGIVTARDCATPLQNVVIDVWGANDAGCYTAIDANGNLTDSCTPRSSDAYNLRGRMNTAADGLYSFTTIQPGTYLNGSRYRPSHLHFLVTPPQGAALITQLYFEGDIYIEGDLGASDPNAAERIIPLVTTDEGLTGRFDIILNVDAPATIAAAAANDNRDAIILTGANPAIDTSEIGYTIATSGRTDVMMFDTLGRHVRTLVDSVHAAGRYNERWDCRDGSGNRVAAGSYICRLRTNASVTAVTVIVQ